MNPWQNRMIGKIQNFMSGRYGQDELSIFIDITALIILIINIFVRTPILSVISLALIIWSLIRILSKKTHNRQRELEAYQKISRKPKAFFKMIKLNITDKSRRYYLCGCGAILRVPRGRGKIEVTCPKCHKIYNKHS